MEKLSAFRHMEVWKIAVCPSSTLVMTQASTEAPVRQALMSMRWGHMSLIPALESQRQVDL